MQAAAEIESRILYANYGRTLVIMPGEGEDPDVLFDEACQQFANTQIEQDAEGNVYIMSPTGGESASRNSEITAQLTLWARSDSRGKSFDSSVEFILPDGSKLSPDASWVSFERLKTLDRKQRREFLRLVPEFVIELKSPTDRWAKLQDKMRLYLANGVSLGWLIDPDKRTVEVYRLEGETEIFTSIDEMRGEGPVAGFALDLKPVWQGLDF
jgi:Uma2 family endonuclease